MHIYSTEIRKKLNSLLELMQSQLSYVDDSYIADILQ